MKLLDGIQGENLFDFYLPFRDDTESPMIFHRWALAGGIASLLRRNTWIEHGPMRIYPNMYIQLIGSPGTRKSTAIKMVKSMIQAVGYETIAADKTSKEKFLLDLDGFSELDEDELKANPDKALDKILGLDDSESRCISIFADEFNEFVGSGNIEFLSLLGNLWDYEGIYKSRLKNSKSLEIRNPTVTILSGNTPTSFALAIPPESGGQGFLSRLILIHARDSGKKIAFPKEPDSDDLFFFQNAMANIERRCIGPLQISDSVAKLLETIYVNWRPLTDSRLTTYSTRRFTHLLKLLIICVAARVAVAPDDELVAYEVTEEDVYYANSMLAHAEAYMADALGEYGKSQTAQIAHRIIEVVDNATREGRTVKHSEIAANFTNEFKNIQELVQLIQSLVTSKKIGLTHTQGADQIPCYISSRTPIKVKSEKGHFDMNLMWEVRNHQCDMTTVR